MARPTPTKPPAPKLPVNGTVEPLTVAEIERRKAGNPAEKLRHSLQTMLDDPTARERAARYIRSLLNGD